MNLIQVVISAIIYILPAYVANSSALLLGGGRPVDGGRKFRGKRILGDGKTVRGLVAGVSVGSLAGVGLSLLFNDLLFFPLGIVLSVGALSGDLVASLLKRQLGIKRGGLVPLLDQLDFVFGAVILGSFIKVPALNVLLVILILTPFVHLFTNLVAYLFGLKKDPW